MGLVIFAVDKRLITRVLPRLLRPATRPCYVDQLQVIIIFIINIYQYINIINIYHKIIIIIIAIIKMLMIKIAMVLL